jgi:hypothetical protein
LPLLMTRKRKGRRKHSEFAGMTAEEVAELAHDSNIPPGIRRKAQTEEKARRRRNRQKRTSR